MMNKVILFTTMLFLFSCKSYDVTPGAERIRVFEAEPKNCIYVGEVSSVQEDETVGTLETEMDLATRVDLRNKAHKLGGNIIVFLKGKNTNNLPNRDSVSAIVTGTKAAAGGAGTAAAAPKPATPETKKATDEEVVNEIRRIIFLATVFRCPSSILNQ
ncbi:MAG: DUF4156 domain-containing protein [Bdellovibrionota bacterium]